MDSGNMGMIIGIVVAVIVIILILIAVMKIRKNKQDN
jgi:heme/copper-type cytochrome/quinol oxidase subunit 2